MMTRQRRHAPAMLIALALTALAAAVPLAANATENAPAVSPAPPAPPKTPQPAPQPVDIAICLDTSNSMDGLIDSAKKKLWTVVTELAEVKPRPILRVALYEYGNTGLSKEVGWVRQVSPLTDDLDAIYGKLFELKTNGGTELVARVVRSATMELDWSADRRALKMIVVAGNEAATQDKTFQLETVCREAIGQGIIINTIFCGPEATGRKTGWADAASWADGQYAAIDQNQGTVVVQAPQDKVIAELGRELNETYVPVGQEGQKAKANQVQQDSNAASTGTAAAADRAAAKATKLYNNARWDLVDAVAAGKVEVEEVDKKDLPEPLQKMTTEQLKAHVTAQATRRAEIQSRIHKLNRDRQRHVEREMAARGLDETRSFDANLRKAIREQVQRKAQSENPSTPATEDRSAESPSKGAAESEN